MKGDSHVLGIPIPKIVVIWAFPSHITLAIWVRVKVKVYTWNAHNVSVKSKIQHAPLGFPRAFDTFAVLGRREFDYQSLPGGEEFDPHALGVGNLNCTLDFM